MWHNIGDEPSEFPIMGDAATNAAVRESARRIHRRHRSALYELSERLMIEGIEHNINIDDLERLAVPSKRAALMRAILIELMVCVRTVPGA
jgi:hypothetical protein